MVSSGYYEQGNYGDEAGCSIRLLLVTCLVQDHLTAEQEIISYTLTAIVHRGIYLQRVLNHCYLLEEGHV